LAVVIRVRAVLEIPSHADVDPLAEQIAHTTSHDWPTTFQLVWPFVGRSAHLVAVFLVVTGNVILVGSTDL